MKKRWLLFYLILFTIISCESPVVILDDTLVTDDTLVADDTLVTIQDTRVGDSLALVELNVIVDPYKGESALFWDYKKPLEEWDNISLNSEGRVESLYISGWDKVYLLSPNHFPIEFGNLTQIKSLDFAYQPNLRLPEEITKLKKLETLSLYGIGISSSIGIQYLTNIQTLSLTYCGLKDIPPEVTSLTSLTGLSLFENQLKTLPKEIENLSQLHALRVDMNYLTTLPLEITKLTPSSPHTSFANNSLKRENLSEEVIEWLNKYDPDWEKTQRAP